jgi:hypothetical protein
MVWLNSQKNRNFLTICAQPAAASQCASTAAVTVREHAERQGIGNRNERTAARGEVPPGIRPPGFWSASHGCAESRARGPGAVVGSIWDRGVAGAHIVNRHWPRAITGGESAPWGGRGSQGREKQPHHAAGQSGSHCAQPVGPPSAMWLNHPTAMILPS